MKKKLINIAAIAAILAVIGFVAQHYGSRAIDFVIKMHGG